MDDRVDQASCSDYPVSSCADRTLCLLSSLMKYSLMKVSHKKGSDMVSLRYDDRLFVIVSNFAVSQTSTYSQYSMLI